jgi:Branched-chain amino acid transport protein (AzlD)
MSSAWVVIAGLAAGTMILRASGPVMLGGREPPARAMAVIALVAPAVLAGLVIYETFTASHSGITVDARVAGLAVAGVAIAVRAPLTIVVLLAAAATAAARALM